MRKLAISNPELSSGILHGSPINLWEKHGAIYNQHSKPAE